MRTRGFTLAELMIVLTVVSTLLTVGWSGARAFREASELQAAARRATAQLSLARRLAVNRRETIRVRLLDGDLALTDVDGRPLLRVPVGGPDGLPVDSVDVRPATMRFNNRGQAAPGSVYLYRGRRSIRIVCNFLGRLRIEGVEVSP